MAEEKSNLSDSKVMDKLVSLCKRRGFIFQNSEIDHKKRLRWNIPSKI